MQPTNNQFAVNGIATETFESEIQDVQKTLFATTSDLTNPLGDLVRAQIRRSQPPLCAAVVLAVSKPFTAEQEESEFYRKRILLAAALEMLHIALNVHRLLVNAARKEQGSQEGSDAALDRAFIGSTILAGDYCFSRAAQMAAQTDNPRVVATFSFALQSVSEGLLREQFNAASKANRYDEMRQLLQSGAHAGAQLAELPTKQEAEAIALSQEFAARLSLYQQEKSPVERQPSAPHSDSLPPNWQFLHQWFTHQRTNGELPLSMPQPYG